MSKFSRKLLILALLSTFAAASSGSAVAAQKGGKNKHKQQATEQKHDDDHDAAVTLKNSVVTVINRGAGPLTITAAPSIDRLSGKGNFAIVPPDSGTPCAPSLVVAPRGGKCTIGVQYTPSGDGKSTARLTLTDTGAATSTQKVVLKSD